MGLKVSWKTARASPPPPLLSSPDDSQRSQSLPLSAHIHTCTHTFVSTTTLSLSSSWFSALPSLLHGFSLLTSNSHISSFLLCLISLQLFNLHAIVPLPLNFSSPNLHYLSLLLLSSSRPTLFFPLFFVIFSSSSSGISNSINLILRHRIFFV